MSKLRIANYYESDLGRNDGNPLYMWNAFGRYGDIESGHLRPVGDLTKWGTWDFHFEADWGEDALYGILPYKPVPIPSPNAFWHSDTHMGYEWRLAKARKTDWNFCCQMRAVEDFRKAGIQNVYFMPHAVEPMAYPCIPSIKKFDIVFVGHINDQTRIDLLDRAFKEFDNFWYGQRRFDDAAEKFCQSKIVLNHSIRDDINMRTFESMATGSFLLTSNIPTLHELFKDGEHLVTYKNHDDMVDKARYYLLHDEEREKIAKAGMEEVLSKHTFRHRITQFLETTGLMEKLKEPTV